MEHFGIQCFLFLLHTLSCVHLVSSICSYCGLGFKMTWKKFSSKCGFTLRYRARKYINLQLQRLTWKDPQDHRLCLKSLRTSGVYREPRSGSRYRVRISKWLLQSHLTMVHVFRWRKSTKFNFWLSSNFWHFDFWHCRLSAFQNVLENVLNFCSVISLMTILIFSHADFGSFPL